METNWQNGQCSLKNSETTGDQKDFIKNKIYLILRITYKPANEVRVPKLETRCSTPLPPQFMYPLFLEVQKAAWGQDWPTLQCHNVYKVWNVSRGCYLFFIKCLLFFRPMKSWVVTHHLESRKPGWGEAEKLSHIGWTTGMGINVPMLVFGGRHWQTDGGCPFYICFSYWLINKMLYSQWGWKIGETRW